MTSVAEAPHGIDESVRSTGILHFTIGVRDHNAAAKFYCDVLGCKHISSGRRYAFMECGGSHFVLAKMPNHVNPNLPGDDAHHHAFIVDAGDFDHALHILKQRGVDVFKYSDTGHQVFPGRHAYFHDADGNGIEIYARFDEPR